MESLEYCANLCSFSYISIMDSLQALGQRKVEVDILHGLWTHAELGRTSDPGTHY